MDQEDRHGRPGGRDLRPGLRIYALLGLVALGGCKVLSTFDFGGVEKELFEFRFGWEKGITDAAPGTPPGGVDKGGVYNPETPAATAALSFPGIHAGVAGEIYPKGKITPIVNVELARVKAPYAGWWEFQVGAGNQLAEFAFVKKLTSVFEITAGPWVGWDFDQSYKHGPNTLDKMAWGVLGGIIKF